MVCLGDAIDLGPVRTYLYTGNWKVGAHWLREQRQHVIFRQSPAEWYQQTTFISEDMGDSMVKRGQTFYDYPALLAQKETYGSSLFHIPGFHDAEVLGSSRNWLNRGDYYFAAQNLGGFEAVQRGVDAIHRHGGHILYYVEGLIMWKRSRIGHSQGEAWALMKQDGTYEDHYRGFWHMCPACEDWCRWLGRTCADVVQSTGIDGFFIDSSTATHFHRCYNPAHHHTHPDVWNWGIRQMLRIVREEVDKVNPNTILFVEGAADIAREYVDGFVAHTHQWSGKVFTEPFVRFIYPQMRAYESWASRQDIQDYKPLEYLHLWNSVTGHRIYAHSPNAKDMAQLGHHTRRYYDLYPEVCDNQMSMFEVSTHGCLVYLFDAMPMVMTVANLTPVPSDATLTIPIPGGILFDRVTGQRVPLQDGHAKLLLEPWEFRVYEIRA
jgi:hypothetical protein